MPASTVMVYESAFTADGNAPYAEPLSQSAHYWRRGNEHLTDPTDSSSIAGVGLNMQWQSPVAIERHGQAQIIKGVAGQTGNWALGGATFIATDGHAKFLKASPENQSAQVSLGYVATDNIAGCYAPSKMPAGYVMTFCPY